MTTNTLKMKLVVPQGIQFKKVTDCNFFYTMFKPPPEKPPRTREYVEEAFRLIQQKKNIRDIVIINERGNPVKSTMEYDASVKFVGYFQEIRGRLERGMEKIDPSDELLMLRVRTKIHEVLLVPDSKITLMVVQNAEK